MKGMFDFKDMTSTEVAIYLRTIQIDIRRAIATLEVAVYLADCFRLDARDKGMRELYWKFLYFEEQLQANRLFYESMLKTVGDVEEKLSNMSLLYKIGSAPLGWRG